MDGEVIVHAVQRGDVKFLTEERVDLLRRMNLEPEEEVALKSFQV